MEAAGDETFRAGDNEFTWTTVLSL